MTGIVAVKGMLFTQLLMSEISSLVHVCTVKGRGPFFAFYLWLSFDLMSLDVL
jgi:hypothetical protein